eukprot:scaffold111603_cov19-Tisochrysis_lutea.AAC.3
MAVYLSCIATYKRHGYLHHAQLPSSCMATGKMHFCLKRYFPVETLMAANEALGQEATTRNEQLAKLEDAMARCGKIEERH